MNSSACRFVHLQSYESHWACPALGTISVNVCAHSGRRCARKDIFMAYLLPIPTLCPPAQRRFLLSRTLIRCHSLNQDLIGEDKQTLASNLEVNKRTHKFTPGHMQKHQHRYSAAGARLLGHHRLRFGCRSLPHVAVCVSGCVVACVCGCQHAMSVFASAGLRCSLQLQFSQT